MKYHSNAFKMNKFTFQCEKILTCTDYLSRNSDRSYNIYSFRVNASVKNHSKDLYYNASADPENFSRGVHP